MFSFRLEEPENSLNTALKCGFGPSLFKKKINKNDLIRIKTSTQINAFKIIKIYFLTHIDINLQLGLGLVFVS